MPAARDHRSDQAIDESGNFDFSPNGTKVLVLTCVAMNRRFLTHQALDDIRYDLLERDINVDYVRAADDRQAVRDLVFTAIIKGLRSFTATRSLSVGARQIQASERPRSPRSSARVCSTG
jgi:hypothetical protein